MKCNNWRTKLEQEAYLKGILRQIDWYFKEASKALAKNDLNDYCMLQNKAKSLILEHF